MTASAIRINARLTGEDAKRFQELLNQEKASVTDVIRESVKDRHAKLIKPRKSAYQLLLESGLIGSIKGARDSSSKGSIRKAMDDVLHAKYPKQFRDKP